MPLPSRPTAVRSVQRAGADLMDFATFVELFTWPLVALFLSAVAAPLVGCFLAVRGTAFHGIVLPQVAAFGVALGFALEPFLAGHGSGGHVAHDVPQAYLLGWALAAVAAAMIALGRLRSSEASASSFAAAVFAIASGGAVLAAQLAPHGGLHVDALLRGETLATGAFDAVLIGAAAALTLAVVLFRWRDLTTAGHDPDFLAALGQSPSRTSLPLHWMTAIVVIVGSLTIGVLAMFALLVLPPLAARRWAKSMKGMLLAAPLVGVLSAGTGAVAAFFFDLPMNASVVGGAAIVSGGSIGASWILDLRTQGPL